LPKHKVEQRIRSDGILVRAGLVELVGYDEDTNFAHAPKVMALTQYARDAIYHGFFDKDEDETAQIILDEEQFVEFASTLSAFEAQMESVHSDVETLHEKYEDISKFVMRELYYEVAMLRYIVSELNVPREVMQEKAEEYRNKYNKDNADLKEEFYSDETSS
jgi:predicted NodU family carbamoyl transferase